MSIVDYFYPISEKYDFQERFLHRLYKKNNNNNNFCNSSIYYFIFFMKNLTFIILANGTLYTTGTNYFLPEDFFCLIQFFVFLNLFIYYIKIGKYFDSINKKSNDEYSKKVTKIYINLYYYFIYSLWIIDTILMMCFYPKVSAYFGIENLSNSDVKIRKLSFYAIAFFFNFTFSLLHFLIDICLWIYARNKEPKNKPEISTPFLNEQA